MKLLSLIAFLILVAPVRADEIVYVQAVKAALKKDPRMDAPNLTELKRGDELVVLKKQEPWYQVSFKKQNGWVSRLFVNSHKPIGQADLNKDVKENLEKASRRRSSSYAVSASTRALTAGNRIREGRELYRTDFEALQEIDNLNVQSADIESFRKSARLSH